MRHPNHQFASASVRVERSWLAARGATIRADKPDDGTWAPSAGVETLTVLAWRFSFDGTWDPAGHYDKGCVHLAIEDSL